MTLTYTVTVTALPLTYIPSDCPDRQWVPVPVTFEHTIPLGEVRIIEIPVNILTNLTHPTYTCTDDVALVRLESAPSFV